MPHCKPHGYLLHYIHLRYKGKKSKSHFTGATCPSLYTKMLLTLWSSARAKKTLIYTFEWHFIKRLTTGNFINCRTRGPWLLRGMWVYINFTIYLDIYTMAFCAAILIKNVKMQSKLYYWRWYMYIRNDNKKFTCFVIFRRTWYKSRLIQKENKIFKSAKSIQGVFGFCVI